MGAKEILNKMTPYQQGKQTEEIMEQYGLEKVIKLSSNENPFGYSPILKKSFAQLNQSFHIYPDGYAGKLRRALADKFDVEEENLVLGSGSDELVQLICRAYLYPGVNTIMATSTFPQYKQGALIEGAEIREIDTVNGRHDLEAMEKAIDENTNVLWICSPDNPTGTIVEKETFYEFLKRIPSHVLVILDEAYYEFVEDKFKLDAIERINTFKNLVVLRTFSKAYGLAGLRIGYGIAHEDIAKKLNTVRGPFNTTSLSQEAAIIALSDQQFIEDTILKNNRIKKNFQQFLDTIGWNYYESHTNFLLVSTPISGTETFNYLLEHGFIVRPGELLGYPNTIRITIGNEKDILELQRVIKQFDLMLNNKE